MLILAFHKFIFIHKVTNRIGLKNLNSKFIIKSSSRFKIDLWIQPLTTKCFLTTAPVPAMWQGILATLNYLVFIVYFCILNVVDVINKFTMVQLTLS